MAEERAQRRLAAILAADVVGYSRLMREDETGTLAQLKVLRKEVFDPRTAEHSGRIVKTTGDGALVEFASAVDATECAIKIQRALARRNEDVPEVHRIELRIGINLGDIIVDGEDIYGDGVNVAARLEGLCEVGEVYISAAVHDQVEGKIGAAFEDLGERTVKNIDKPIRVYRISTKPKSVEAATTASEADSLFERPAVAVLPFENIGGDPEQEYFADGLTEDIITALSLWRSFPVIARNSTFTYKGRSVKVQEVAEELGARYVLEGSVRKGGDRVRVTAQLIDAETGHHVWAERYDRDLEDIFAVQDEITQAIVSTLPGRMEDAGRVRAQRKRNPDMTAYDHLLLGLERFNRFSREDNVQARQHSQMAVDRDPLFARAHTLLAATHLWDILMYAQDDGSLDKAFKSVEAALGLDDGDSWSHGILGWALYLHHQDEESEIHLRRALTLNPNDANAAAYFGLLLVYLGRWEEGLDWITKAKRLNPFPPANYHWYQGIALYSAHEFEQAIQAVKQIRVLDRWHHGLLAMCYAQLGRMDETGVEIAQFLEPPEHDATATSGALTADILELALERVNRYRIKADRDHFLDGLRKAGLPE
jgi:adenylate cyclase